MNFKKPKFWDLGKPNFLSYILFPFTIFVRINNFFLNNLSFSKNDEIKTICIGNIYVGGTGKTPACIKVYNLLKKLDFNLVIGKKNYSNQQDEQIILKNKSKLIVAKNRNSIIQHALNNKHNLIIFDDGLQDKKINYNLKFVCFDTEHWIGNGQLIPSGPLREKLKSLKKYDAIFLNNNNDKNLDTILDSIKKISPSIKIFVTTYEPTNLESLDLTSKYLIFSGIGNPDNFKNTLLKKNFIISDELIFPDHYNYKDSDINDILKKAKNSNAKIITTEKDFVKIPNKFQKDINCLNIDLKILEEVKLLNFLKLKLNEKF